jgi:hypothetical protein
MQASTDSVDIRNYNIPIDVIEHYILKFIKYSRIDGMLSGFRLTPKEHASIKYRVYNKRLVIKRSPYSIYYAIDGVTHREGDLPAAIQFNDYFDWFYHGVRHREHGPAMMWVHPCCYFYARTSTIHVNNIGIADNKPVVPVPMPSVPDNELLYKNGNHPRPYGWAVLAFYDGVHFLDYHGTPVVDNGPIAVHKIVGGWIMKYGKTIDSKYHDEIIDTDEPPDTKYDFMSEGRIKLINWDEPLPIPITK